MNQADSNPGSEVTDPFIAAMHEFSKDQQVKDADSAASEQEQDHSKVPKFVASVNQLPGMEDSGREVESEPSKKTSPVLQEPAGEPQSEKLFDIKPTGSSDSRSTTRATFASAEASVPPGVRAAANTSKANLPERRPGDPLDEQTIISARRLLDHIESIDRTKSADESKT